MECIALKTKGLTKAYGKHLAVNNVDIKVKQGEIYGVVGKNGAGKTTLLRMITGLIGQTKGEMELFGETSKDGLNKSRMRTGCIIETPSFYPYLSARKNLEYYRIQRGIVEPNVVDKALEIVGLNDTGKKTFKKFSLGMKQRLGLALAIMANPDMLILDEPINGLDPTGIVEFRDILLRLNRERNVTIIISSHILSELQQLATTYGFINNGELIEQISARDLEEKCKSCLAIKVNNTDKAVVIIESKLKTDKYEVLNGNEIRLYDYIDKAEDVVDVLVNNGVRLSSISEKGTNLEDYFIKLIGGNRHD